MMGRDLIWDAVSRRYLDGSILDLPIKIPGGIITCKKSANFVFWDRTRTNEPLESQVALEAEFGPSEQIIRPHEDARPPRPRSIQHKIKSLLLDMNFLPFEMLVQFWAPIKTSSGQIMLTTAREPFAIGCHFFSSLSTYRYYCTPHQYSVSPEDHHNTQLGPPGRVFTLGSPEFCPDITSYSAEEFPLRKHAIDCHIQAYCAFPLFQRDGPQPQHCIGVLEFLSFSAWDFFSSNLNLIIPALEDFDLEYQTPHKCHKISSHSTRQFLYMVVDRVRKKHKLPLIQVWVPCLCDIAPDASGEFNDENSCSSSNPATSGISKLFCEFTDCNPKLRPLANIKGFNFKGAASWVTNGRSLVGRAYSQRKSCFVEDMSQLSISDYPLVHIIRSSGLKACFAIPLQLIHPEFDPFVLEIFLPPQQNCDGNLEPILKSLLSTIKIACSRNNKVPVDRLCVQFSHLDYDNFVYLDVYRNGGSSDAAPRKRQYSSLSDRPSTRRDKAKTLCSRGVGDFPNAEAEITLDHIRPYFDGNLDDAAEKLGVSRSTLERICRKHGIKEWPSHKRKKGHRIQSSPRTPTRFLELEGGATAEVFQESEINVPGPNNNGTGPETPKRKSIAAQDEIDRNYTVMIKATHKDDIVMFPFCANSGIEELRRELDKRLELNVERFKIKHEDEGDWILISCDEDLRFRMDTLKSSGQTRMNMTIFPATL